MPANSVPFVWYGILQIMFVFILFSNFILTMSYLLLENDEGTHKMNAINHTKSNYKWSQDVQTADLVLPLIIASGIMLLMSCAIFYILIYKARKSDMVGNLCIRKRTASFKVALLSWILTNIETILRLIGLFNFKSGALDACGFPPWGVVAGYHILLLFQTTFQIGCLHTYEKNTSLRREGPGWMITRKSFLIIMAFMNCYMWMLNVVKIQVLVDLTSKNMEHLLSPSVERIIYTVNRASTLAYHVESVQLFYKFYEEDNESLIQQSYQNLDSESMTGGQVPKIVETESAKGKWGGFFMFVLFVSMAGGSFLVRTDTTSIHYFATFATIGILLTIFIITLNTTLSHKNSKISLILPPANIHLQNENDLQRPAQEENQHLLGNDTTFVQGRANGFHASNKPELGNPQYPEPRHINMFEDITSYMAGEQVGHLRILLFYSICAVSYHFLLTIKIILNGVEVDVYQPLREGAKGVTCICLTVFMFWMSHEHRKLRCWRDLNVMFWNVSALVLLELIEETFEHGNAHTEPLQLYALPLAIDFKIYVLIHTYSDTIAARHVYRQELQRDALTSSDLSSRSSRPSTPGGSLTQSIHYI